MYEVNFLRNSSSFRLASAGEYLLSLELLSNKLFNFAKQIQQDTLELNDSCWFAASTHIYWYIFFVFFVSIERISILNFHLIRVNEFVRIGPTNLFGYLPVPPSHLLWLSAQINSFNRVLFASFHSYLMFCKYFISEIELRIQSIQRVLKCVYLSKLHV